jgi:hypothetical protein
MTRPLQILFCALLFILSGCGTARITSTPYSRTEAQVLRRLGIDKGALTETKRKRTQIEVDQDLKKYMRMGVFAVDLQDYQPDDHIRFIAHHLYNIGAVGGEYVQFEIRRLTRENTRVFVDYSDRAIGCLCFPFAYINPGINREERILEYLLDQQPKETSANKVLENTGTSAPDPQH